MTGVIPAELHPWRTTQEKARYNDDPAVHRQPSRRDWIEIHLRSPEDLDGLADLLAIAVASNDQ